MTDEIENNLQEQRQRDREARIRAARECARASASLAHAFSDEAWAEVEKEIA